MKFKKVSNNFVDSIKENSENNLQETLQSTFQPEKVPKKKNIQKKATFSSSKNTISTVQFSKEHKKCSNIGSKGFIQRKNTKNQVQQQKKKILQKKKTAKKQENTKKSEKQTNKTLKVSQKAQAQKLIIEKAGKPIQKQKATDKEELKTSSTIKIMVQTLPKEQTSVDIQLEKQTESDDFAEIAKTLLGRKQLEEKLENLLKRAVSDWNSISEVKIFNRELRNLSG